MTRKFTLLTLSLFFYALAFAQSTYSKVYQIFQEKCVGCHDHDSPQAGLDLEGTGANETAKALSVYFKLNGVTPNNEHAAQAGYKRIYRGRPDRSFLFRKINRNLEPTIALASGEMNAMPPEGQPQLTVEEKELIRQWILFGASSTGNLVDEALIDDYYAGNGQEAFPGGPPPAPSVAEGFQIKMGPFFIEPGGELEYFQKYELDLPADLDVNRLEVMMGNFSHHFILYDFNPGGDNSIQHGLRLDADHSDIGLVAAVQESTDLRLPEGTAFIWDKDLVLDLNSHYINYSATNVYKAEVYLNVYTQRAGSAAQEMLTDLVVNNEIPIPNNGEMITHTQQVAGNVGEVFVWGLMGHTHQYGAGYKVYKRLPSGVKGDLIYDAACPQGVPGCVSPFFDYQHIPMRYFEPLFPLTFNTFNGIIHEANWINDGPVPVNFGPTSNDEMMVLVIMYTEDTTGVIFTDVIDQQAPLSEVRVFPNPAQDVVSVMLPANGEPLSMALYDMTGREIRRWDGLDTEGFSFQRGSLPPGIYLYRVANEVGQGRVGRIVFQ